MFEIFDESTKLKVTAKCPHDSKIEQTVASSVSQDTSTRIAVRYRCKDCNRIWLEVELGTYPYTL